MSSNQNTTKQVSFTGAFVCKTKFNSLMFRIIKSKYLENKYLKQKLKKYENEYYIHINEKKISIDIDKKTRYKIWILFEDFEDAGDYILYYKQVLVKKRGELPERQFNNDIVESDSEEDMDN